MVVSRLNTDGSLDTDFANNGSYIYALGAELLRDEGFATKNNEKLLL